LGILKLGLATGGSGIGEGVTTFSYNSSSAYPECATFSFFYSILFSSEVYLSGRTYEALNDP